MTENLIQKLELKIQTKDSPIIAIVGPTASGKSNLAIKIAKTINGEIISADSRLVYKGFDIATAKPTLAEREGVKHYLIDIVEPEIDYSVANFFDDAQVAIREIRQKGKIPIIVGGTGLYFRILLEDFDLPRVKPNYKLREKLEKLDSQELHEMLKELDVKSAEKIHVNNKVRIIRAIEVCKTLEKPHSEAAGKKDPEFDVEWIGLSAPTREELYQKINDRVDKMVEKGLLEETKYLLERHGRINNLINTIGYQEIIEYLDGKISFDAAVLNLKKHTRHYAKRQLTWFRRSSLINWNYLI